MYKRIIIVILLVSTLIMLNGCESEPSINHTEVAEQQSKMILEGVLNKNPENIEEVFCTYVKENDSDLEEDIMELLEFIDGEIVSYDEPEGKKGGGATDEWGVIEQSISASIKNIKTSTGKTYRIGHGGYSVYKEHPDYVGVTSITIRDVDMYDPDTGEGQYIIWLPEMFN